MGSRITLVTGNKNKIAKARQFLGDLVDFVDMDMDEIQENDALKVSQHKVKQAYSILQKPVITWDASVYISALNGFPGPLIKWFWTRVGLQKICDLAYLLGDTKISLELIITYFDGKGIRYFTKTQEGLISKEPRGDKGWDWDTIFIPTGSDKTFGEMEDKDMLDYPIVSGLLEELKDYLKEID